jgi:hypothetical protein
MEAVAKTGYPPGRRRTNFPEAPCPKCGRVMPVCNLARHEPKCGLASAGTVPMDEQLEIVKLYNQPRMSLSKVAAVTHWSETTCRRVLLAHDVSLRGTGYSFPRIGVNEQLKRTELYGRGYSVAEVADLCGVTYEAVRQTLVRMGVPRRGERAESARERARARERVGESESAL